MPPSKEGTWIVDNWSDENRIAKILEWQLILGVFSVPNEVVATGFMKLKHYFTMLLFNKLVI